MAQLVERQEVNQSQSRLLAAVKEKEHKNRRKSYKQIQLETKTIGSFSAVTLDTALDDSTINNKKDNEGKQQGGTYNLSCKVCNCKSHHYTGQTDDLMSTLKELPNSLSRSIKTQQRRTSNEEGRYLYKSVLVIDESVSSNTENTDASSADFLSSPFAKHVINQHLQDAKGKKDVINWYKENVAVKIKTHKYEKKPSVEGVSFKAKQKPKFVIQQEEKEEEVKKILKREEEEYKEKLAERNALTNDTHVFDEVWMSRYKELKQFANDNDGNTRVPENYTKSPLLHKWIQSQRDQYRRKHNIRPKKLNPELDGGRKIILSDSKEKLLKDIGFVWFDVPKQRWDEQGILVCQGWDSGVL